MTRSTHVSIGVACGLLISQLRGEDVVAAMSLALVTAFAAVAPDFDIRLGIKHRGITHTLIALTLIAVVSVHFLPEGVAICLIAGYASHLLADALTVRGIPFFSPLVKRNISFLALRTGGVVDHLIGVIAAFLILYSLWQWRA